MSPVTNQAMAPRVRRAVKRKRIAFRLTDELAAQLQRAVAISGRNQSDLITEAIADKTHEIIRQGSLLELANRDMDALLAALAAPPEPNAVMQRAVARWRERGSPV